MIFFRQIACESSTREEVEEVFVQLTIYAGIPRAIGGVQAAKRAFAKIDARAARL